MNESIPSSGPNEGQAGSSISLDVDLVASQLAAIRARIKSVVDQGGSSLEIDMAKVRMVDSMGIGLLVAAHNSLSRRGGALRIKNLSDDLVKLFKSMRLDQRFQLVTLG